MTVAEYCQEEVSRQGHNIHMLEGIERVGWMLNGWAYALNVLFDFHPYPTVDSLLQIGRMVEPYENSTGWRTCQVMVGGNVCPNPDRVPTLLVSLFESLPSYLDEGAVIPFYKALLEIHPFLDGNGRTGKIILNWLNGSLLNPIFPPNNLWGREIRNP